MDNVKSCLRESNANDLDAIIALYNDLAPDDLPLPIDKARNVYTEFLDNNAFKILVCEYKEIIVSSCVLSMIPNLTRGGSPYALIENVITLRRFRKQGFGAKIINHALDLAEGKGCYKVMLLTGSKKESTHRFYTKLGFSGTDKTAYVIKKNVPAPDHY